MNIFNKKSLRMKKNAETYVPRRRLSQERSPIASLPAKNNTVSLSSDGSTQKKPDIAAGFLRNRTIGRAGSVRVSGAGVQDSPREKLHILIKARRRIIIFLGVVFIACLFFGVLLFQYTARPVFKIDGVQIAAADNDRYRGFFTEYFQKNPMQRFRFLLDTDQLTAFLQMRAPELAQLDSVHSSSLGESTFFFMARTPVASWQIGEKLLFVDATGISFMRNYFVTPSILIIDSAGISQNKNAGAVLTTARLLSFVGLLVNQANTSGLVVRQIELPKDTTREIHVYFKDSTSYAKMSIDRSAAEQIEDVHRATTWFKKQSIVPQYLDVRVKQKVYYR